MATGQNPGERERRRWAALLLDGKRYTRAATTGEVHLDLRASPKITLRNMARSPETWTAHQDCGECADIIAAAGRAEPLMTDEQWRTFRLPRRT